jgi:hypothetical protein
MSFIVGFYNKYKFQVDNETGKKLQDLWLKQEVRGFRMNGNAYAFASIESIVDKYDAYDVYPKEFELLNKMEDVPTSQLQLESPNLKQLQ